MADDMIDELRMPFEKWTGGMAPMSWRCKRRGHVELGWFDTYQPHTQMQRCDRCGAFRLRTKPESFSPDPPNDRSESDVADSQLLEQLMNELWDSLGSGVWLEPNDYEALRDTYNKLAQAAEDACTVYRRLHR